MSELLNILKALALGVCVSVPVGPIAILVIRNTLSKGWKAGFLTGLGATVVDTTWALVSVFALGFAEHLLETQNTVIMLVGGILIIAIGIFMALSNPFVKLDRKEMKMEGMSLKDFGMALVMGFSNPGAILVVFALFATFGIEVSASQGWGVLPVVLAVTLGSVLYWAVFADIFRRLRKSFNPRILLWVNRIMGAAVVVMGIYLLIKAF